MGGLRFAGVDGAPDRPWKLRQEQLPVPRRHGLSDQRQDRVPRRLRQVLPQPDESGRTTPGSACPRRSSRRTTATARRPTRWATPGRTGSRTPPGSSLGPETFLGRGPTTSNPDFVVPNVHQFSAGIQRELPWRISLEATYAGSRSYDIEGNFGGFNEPSAAFQAQCDVTLGGSRSFCDQTAAESVLRCRRLRGHDPVHEPDALALRAGAAVPGIHRVQPEPAEPREDAVRLGAVRRRTSAGPRASPSTPATPGCRAGRKMARIPRRASATPMSTRSRCSRTTVRTSHSASTASPRRACGSCRGTATSAASRATCSAAGRSRRCSSSRAASRGTCRATSNWRRASTSPTSRCPGRRTGSSSTA